MTDGNILYVSESITSLLEHLPVSNTGPTFFFLVFISHLPCCRTGFGRIFGLSLVSIKHIKVTIVCFEKGLATLLNCLFSHPLCVFPQTDLVDQNLLNFLPIGEHSDVYKALSTHPTDPESLSTDFMKSQ